MKKHRLFSAGVIALAAGLLLACSDSSKGDDPIPPTPDPDPDPDPVLVQDTVIYAVGQEQVTGAEHYYATIWKDGKKILLSDGANDGFCLSACTVDEKVYVVGCEATGDLFDDGYYEPYHLNVGVLWQFDVNKEGQFEHTNLSDGKVSTATSGVAVSKDNIYVSGSIQPGNDRTAVYWKNGTMSKLTDGTTDALANCVITNGDDFYIGGYEQTADKSGGYATIWKNGVAHHLTDGTTLAKVMALYYDNDTLYAAGAEKVTGGRWKGVLWIGDQAKYFTDEAGTEVSGLYVKDGKYVISGNISEAGGNIVTCVWTNEGQQVLSTGIELCQGAGLAVVGKDVYVGGNESYFDTSIYDYLYRSHLWKNGTAQQLEFTNPDNASIWALTYALVEKKDK